MISELQSPPSQNVSVCRAKSAHVADWHASMFKKVYGSMLVCSFVLILL